MKYLIPSVLTPTKRKITYVTRLKNRGRAILEVTGKFINGVTSKRFPTKMNIKTDIKYGVNFSPPLPITPKAISSLTKVNILSITDWSLPGTTDFFLSPKNINTTGMIAAKMIRISVRDMSDEPKLPNSNNELTFSGLQTTLFIKSQVSAAVIICPI